MAAAASWAGTSTDPMAVKRQALRTVPASRAIRRQIKVATEPVSSRPGPMAVDRMAAHSPAVPAGRSAAAAGRLLAAQDSAVPAMSWTARPPRSATPAVRMARIAEAAAKIGIRSAARAATDQRLGAPAF